MYFSHHFYFLFTLLVSLWSDSEFSLMIMSYAVKFAFCEWFHDLCFLIMFDWANNLFIWWTLFHCLVKIYN